MPSMYLAQEILTTLTTQCPSLTQSNIAEHPVDATSGGTWDAERLNAADNVTSKITK